jgi:hypothetical protein
VNANGFNTGEFRTINAKIAVFCAWRGTDLYFQMIRIGRTMKRIQALTAGVAFIFFAAQTAFGAAVITVSSTGSGLFAVQASGMEGAGALDLVLNYDTASLANPRVTQGSLISGAIMAVNVNIPGTIRAAIIRTTGITGSGTLLTIAFDRQGEAAGTIIGMTAKLADTKGQSLQASVQIVNPAETASAGNGASDFFGNTASQQQTTVAQTAQTSTPLIPIPIIVTKTDEDAKSKTEQLAKVLPDQPTAPHEPVTSTTGRKEQTIVADAPAQKKKLSAVYTRKTVLALFRDCREEKTPKTLTGLFDQEPLIGFRQDPLVALSDGKSPVTVRFISTPTRTGTDDLVLTRAKLLSAKKDTDATNTWIVTLLPEVGADAASLSVPQDDLLMVFPLVVAPKVKLPSKKPGMVTEADFVLFLKNRGTIKSPRHDLNHDGARDFKDEYIFTANYLAEKKK